ncbi:Chromatin modification-related protein [Drosera capensis]
MGLPVSCSHQLGFVFCALIDTHSPFSPLISTSFPIFPPKYLMDLDGHHTVSSNPSGTLASLLSKRAKLHEELQSIEKQDPIQCGNVLKGFESFLSSSKTATLMKRSRKFQPEDRLFSLSSITSPAAEDHVLGRDDSAPSRHKGSGMFRHGPGKPKKGRWAARRIRQTDPDFDYEDDPDLM